MDQESNATLIKIAADARAGKPWPQSEPSTKWNRHLHEIQVMIRDSHSWEAPNPTPLPLVFLTDDYSDPENGSEQSAGPAYAGFIIANPDMIPGAGALIHNRMIKIQELLDLLAKKSPKHAWYVDIARKIVQEHTPSLETVRLS